MTALEPQKSMDGLAEAINREHAQCEAALQSGLDHARRAGQYLLEAKRLCEHGAWLPWLAANFAGSERTAQSYMRIVQRWAEIEAANPQRAADLSYREALRALAEPARSALDRTPWETFRSRVTGQDGSFRAELEDLAERLKRLETAAPTSEAIAECRDIADRADYWIRHENQTQLHAEHESWRLAAELAALLTTTTSSVQPTTIHWVHTHLDDIIAAANTRLSEMEASSDRRADRTDITSH